MLSIAEKAALSNFDMLQWHWYFAPHFYTVVNYRLTTFLYQISYPAVLEQQRLVKMLSWNNINILIRDLVECGLVKTAVC